MEGKIDPRVLKTRRKLKGAFLKLLSVQSLSNFNIKDLTQTAEVTRGTFYLHYKDKDTFVTAMMEQLVSELFAATMIEKEGQDTKYFSLNRMLEFVEEHPEFFDALLKDEDAFDYRQLLEYSLMTCIDDYKEAAGIADGKIPKEILLNYLMYTLLGYVDGWISQGKIYATHYMANNLKKILMSEFIEDVGLTEFFVVED
ncbi:TetR/AcrR family transcriptional regulator [Vagococcus elongatus]|uniref:HTH tetR-type domain-containing protein n=1 Tax=Vagococcus elongatus TaxID=180344 RepID=A0A430AY77_9ENTE|nr:TetR/AcrR family transcriptional regulator [Vagococcus elongatus]RSU13022.1 hypothetical protein CBF29_04965 [Vagococcus elongatus]